MSPRRSSNVSVANTNGPQPSSSQLNAVDVKQWSDKLKNPLVSEKSKATLSGASSTGSSSKIIAKSMRARKARNLAHLMEMPLEIFFEVISALHPLDLLRLSRVSRQFRHTFMSKKSIAIWKQAQKTVLGLPECPPTLNEPQYTALLFETNCVACGVPRALKISYTLSIRLCSACWDVNVMQGTKLMKMYCNEHGFNIKDDSIWRIGRMSFTLLSQDDSFRTLDPNPNEYNYFYKPDFDMMMDKLRELVNTTVEYNIFVNERRAFVVKMHEHRIAVAVWQSESKLAEKERLDKIRNRRRANIAGKLSELGYEPEDYPTSSSEWDRLVGIARELTASNWTQIKPKLEKMLEAKAFENRCSTRIAEFQALYRQYVYGLSNANLELLVMLPPPIHEDLLSYKDLIVEGDGQLECRGEQFEKAVAALFLDVEKHKVAEAKRQLIRELLPLYKSPDSQGDNTTHSEADNQVLLNAASMFRCNFSSQCQAFGYLEYIEHTWTSYKTMNWSDQHNFGTCRSGRSSWPPPRLLVHRQASEVAKAILMIVGLPIDTPYAEVSGKILCMCQNSAFKQPATFAQLVQHVLRENEWFDHQMWNKDLRFYGGDFVHHNDHDYSSQSPTLKLELGPQHELPARNETKPLAWPWPVKENDDSSTVACCRICLDSDRSDFRFWFQVNLEDATDFIYHLKAKHLKEPTWDDVGFGRCYSTPILQRHRSFCIADILTVG